MKKKVGENETTSGTTADGVVTIASKPQFSTTGLGGATLGASATRYFSLGGNANSGSVGATRTLMPVAITITAASVFTGSTQDASGSMTFELYVNNAATGLIITVTAGGAALTPY